MKKADYVSNVNNKNLKLVHNIIYKKYFNSFKNKYNLHVINRILSNCKCHIVALFKDFLLYDDDAEFLKRYYKLYEVEKRLKKIFHYFQETSVLYPNYSPLIESKYIYYNIMKKQMIINKIENYKKKKRDESIKKKYNKLNIDDNKEIENNFFSNTIYNDILNESESFMSILFGVDNKNKNNEKKTNEKNENDKEIEEFKMIIDKIQSTEAKKKRVVDLIIGGKDKNKGINYKKPDIASNQMNSSVKFNKNKNNISYNQKIFDNLNSLFIKSMNNSTASGTNSIASIGQGQNNIDDKFKKNKYINHNNFRNSFNFKKPNKINQHYETEKKSNNSKFYKTNNCDMTKENNKNNMIMGSMDKKQGKIVYHRKVKSTIIGDYLNKAELPSNSNVINSLKIANENFASNQNKSIIKSTLYKRIKNNNSNIDINLKNSLTKIIKLPKPINAHNSSATNIKISNSNKDQVINSSKIKVNNISRFNKNENTSKNFEIQIPIISKKPKYLVKKKRSPISTKDYLSSVSVNNNSNEDIFNNEYNKTVMRSTLINSYKKPESEIKSIYVNPNMTGPYSKPKGISINKDKKYFGISAKKLFNNSNDNLKFIKEYNN